MGNNNNTEQHTGVMPEIYTCPGCGRKIGEIKQIGREIGKSKQVEEVIDLLVINGIALVNLSGSCLDCGAELQYSTRGRMLGALVKAVLALREM